MNILRLLNVLLKGISEAFEDYFVDYNSKDSETYRNSSFIKKI